MSAVRLIRAIDVMSYWSGKAFAWLIVALTFVVSPVSYTHLTLPTIYSV